MPKITEMFCFVVSDKDPDDEGVPAIRSPFGPMPLVGADTSRIESLMPHAQRAANEIGKPLRIYKFTHKELIGEIQPGAGVIPNPAIVHGMLEGRALCGFCNGWPPSYWPEGHNWASANNEAPQVTCPACIAKVEELFNARTAPH